MGGIVNEGKRRGGRYVEKRIKVRKISGGEMLILLGGKDNM